MKKLMFAIAVLIMSGSVALACCGGPTCPPLTLSVAASPDTLWPPNHKMVDITLDIETNGLSWWVVSVNSNEPDDGTGDGDTAGDVEITGNEIKVRAERSGTGSGRVYTIVVVATDPCGQVAYASTEVTVPHDKGN